MFFNSISITFIFYYIYYTVFTINFKMSHRSLKNVTYSTKTAKNRIGKPFLQVIF